MLQYNTGIQAAPPVNPALQAKALQGLESYAPFGYAGDVYNAEAQRQAVDYERGAAAANNQFMQQAQQAQQATALQGLQNLAQAQQNENSLANQQNEMRLGYAGRMLGGLNGLIAGLYQ